MMADGAWAWILISEQALFKQEGIWWAPPLWHESLRPQKALLRCSSSIHSTLALNANTPQMLAANETRPLWGTFGVLLCFFLHVFVYFSSALVTEQTNSRSADRTIGHRLDGLFLRLLLGCMKSSVCRGGCIFSLLICVSASLCLSVFVCVCFGECVCVCVHTKRGNGCWEGGCCSCCLQTHNSLSGMLQSRLHLLQLKSVFSHKQQSKTHKN